MTGGDVPLTGVLTAGGAAAERIEAMLLEVLRPAEGRLVPLGAGLLVAVAGTGIAQDQGAHHLRVRQVERQ